MTWKQWLQTDSCHIVLFRSARLAFAQARRHRLPARLYSGLSDTELHGSHEDNPPSIVEELAHELWLFTHDHAERWEAEHPLDIFAAQGTDRIAHRIASAYVKTLLDRARTQEGDPRKALYRRVRQVIARDSRFQYLGERQRAFYACSQSNPTCPDPSRSLPPLPDFADWPAPPISVRGAGPLNAQAIRELALFFCREYMQRVRPDVWIPIRELVRYVSPWVGIHEVPRFVPLESDRPGEEEGPIEIPLPTAPTQESEFVRRRLRELARSVAASWSPNERKAFVLRWGDEQKLERIAQALGYGGASSVRYLLEKLPKRLKDFCLLWPGLSPPDLDEALFMEFYAALVDVCKQDDESRRMG